MDDIDKANELAEKHRESAILKSVKSLKPNGIVYCIDCEAKIPEARKLAIPSCKRCIECQELHDAE